MNSLIYCQRCGRPFEPRGEQAFCIICIEQDELVFRRIKDYLRKYPGARLFQVSTELNIPVAKIKQYLKDDRLEILEKDNSFLKCESCNTPIRSGTHCDDCYKGLNHGYKSLYTGEGVKKSKTRIKYGSSVRRWS